MTEVAKDCPAVLILGDVTLTGNVRSVGGTLTFAETREGEPAIWRNLVLDFGKACKPVELWMPDVAVKPA